MRLTHSSAPLAIVGVLAIVGSLAITPRAEAQVVIQGQVTVQQDPYAQPQYGQPQYGQPQYAQPQYGQPQGNYAQPGDPNVVYQPSGYVAPVVAQGPQPVRYIHRSALIPGILVPGILLLAGGFLAEVVGAPLLSDSWDSSDQLGFAFIPILGPWLQLGRFSDLDRAFETGIAYFPIVAGLAQALGLIVTIIGLSVHDEWDEPVYALTDDPMGPTLTFDGSRATLRF